MKHVDPEARLLLLAPPAPSMPPGLVELMEDLSRNVLKNDPEDIFAFCAEHMRKLLVVRDGEETESKKEKRPLNVKIANVLAASHKKAEKRRASYDRLLAKSIQKQLEQEIVDVNNDGDQSKGELLVEEAVGPLLHEIEQRSETLDQNDEEVKQEKSEDEPRHDFEQTETVVSTVDETVMTTVDKQSLNEGDITINEMKSFQEQPENEIKVAINNEEKEINNNPVDEGHVIIDQETAISETKEEVSDKTSKANEELEAVKRTVSDAIAEIETAAIKTVTNITLNLAKNIQSDNVESEVISQDQEVNQEPTNLDDGEKIVNKRGHQLENIKNEINTVEKGPNVVVTDLKEQTLNEIKAEEIFVTALEEITHNLDAIKSIGDQEPADLDAGEKIIIESVSQSENIKDGINIIEKGPNVVVTDLKEQTLNEIKAEAIFVTALEEITHNLDAVKSIGDPTDLVEGEKIIIESVCQLESIKDEINIIEKGPNVVVTDLKEQTLNEIKAEAIFVTALEELTHNVNAIKSISEINKTTDQLDISQRLTMVLEEPPQEIEAISEKNKTDGNKTMLVQEEIQVQKHVSDLQVVNEEISAMVSEPKFQNVVVTITDTNNEQPSIQYDTLGENDTHKETNLNKDQKESIDNSITKQGNTENINQIAEAIDSENVQPIVNEATDNISNEENVNNKDIKLDKVVNVQNAAEGVIAITEISETQKECQEKVLTSELVTEIATQIAATTNEPLNDIIITVTENKSNSMDSTTNGEEEGANSDIAIDLSNSDRSPRSLKSNDSGDTDDATNGNSAEVDKSIDNSENSANPTMDLETAAVTIQKVFRSFLFKSRVSTIDDETPLDIPYLPDAIQDGDDSENVTKVEEEKEARIPNKERRNIGLSRMDTVLQTVNEEKSLSLSDDSSTLSSAATVIQAHVRGYLVRNKLSKTASSSKSHTQSSELENDQQKNKTVLNIHIVPEGSRFMSRDESLTLSLDLPLDASPPSLTSYHSLGYDITERRKLLRREDAIQSSISPPSTNSGKSLDVPITSNNIDPPEIEDVYPTEDKSESDEVKESEISGDTTPTVSTTAETVIELIKDIEPDSESKESEIKLNSDEFEKPNLTASQEKDVVSEPESAVYSGVLHSGEFHDVVLLPQPTQLSRDDPKQVAREFKANFVYFLVWN